LQAQQQVQAQSMPQVQSVHEQSPAASAEEVKPAAINKHVLNIFFIILKICLKKLKYRNHL
jgi:hypothetical protein